MTMNIPDKNTILPLKDYKKMVYIKNIVRSENIIAGDYSYYDDETNGYNFEKNVLYHFDFIGDKLIIGKFCAIASGVKFIMNGANHQVDAISTFPFYIFGGEWTKATPNKTQLPYKGDTIIGNDVWIGYESVIMPGVKIGNGAIIASKSVVSKDVEPYSIVGGNPAKLIRKRFSDEQIDKLERIAWWNWSIEDITRSLPLITNTNIEEFEKIIAKQP